MRIAVFGAGAVGGHLAVRLARAGHDVSVVARGAHLAAIRAEGLTLIAGEERLHARVAASDDPADLGAQDVVLCTLKSTALGALAAGVRPLLGPETPVVFAQNGIPWWYAQGLADTATVPDLAWLDPGGALAGAVGAARTIGGVILSSNEVIAPGVIRNDSPGHNALVVGEPDGAASDRIATLRAALSAAGIASPAQDDVRAALWRKLIGNMTVSVLCLLTGQTARAAAEDPAFARLVPAMLKEAAAIAAAQGVRLPPLAPGTRAPDHKPSLLQDHELGRPLELDALVRAPLLFARAAGIATPTLDTLGALAERLGRDAGL